jgi:hypothetical protein
MSAQNEKANILSSEGDSVDMFSFTPVVNTNYQYDNPQPVHERLLKAGEYYRNKLNIRQDEIAKQKEIEDELIVKGKSYWIRHIHAFIVHLCRSV